MITSHLTVSLLIALGCIILGIIAFCATIGLLIGASESELPEECRTCGQRFNFSDHSVPPCLYCHKLIKTK